MGRRRNQRAAILRDVKNHMSKALESDQTNTEALNEESVAITKEEAKEGLKEAVESMQKKQLVLTGDFQPGDMINLAIVITYGRGIRWDHKPALVLDGPDRWGEMLLMVIGDPEPRRYPAKMCRPSE
jgi:hypothetical protein